MGILLPVLRLKMNPFIKYYTDGENFNPMMTQPQTDFDYLH